jgi:hypothetical protein
MALDLNTLYQYYIDQGVDPRTAAQYSVYYISSGSKKGFSGITTPKFKPESEIAPTYLKYKQDSDPFIQSLYTAIATPNLAPTDLSALANTKEGIAYAKKNKLSSTDSLGRATPGRLFTLVNNIYSDYKKLTTQKKTLGTYAASIGAPSPDLKFSFKIDPKSYIKGTEIEYDPVRKVYTKLRTEIKDKLIKAKVPQAQIGTTLGEFDVAFETQIQSKLDASNLTPFTNYVLKKGSK